MIADGYESPRGINPSGYHVSAVVSALSSIVLVGCRASAGSSGDCGVLSLADVALLFESCVLDSVKHG